VTRVVRDAKGELNHGGNPGAGPKLASEAVGFGTTLQQTWQLGQLLGRQTPGCPARRAVMERLRPTFAAALHPLADGALADAESLGNPALRPALLLEVPGLQASSFLPVGGCRVPTWQSITAFPEL
jgi:hypothetical protein